MREDKKALRRQLKEIRDSIPEELRKAYSESILSNLLKIEEFKNAGTVLLFANAGSEVLTDGIFLSCIENGKSVYYPKVSGADMVFVKVSDLTELIPGYRGIREPATTLNTLFLESITCESAAIIENGNENKLLTGLDILSGAVIVCPGLGFTKNGERIGYGGGYYDRFVSAYPELRRIGVCFEAQICDHIPTNENDFRMNNVVTEEHIFNLLSQ